MAGCMAQGTLVLEPVPWWVGPGHEAAGCGPQGSWSTGGWSRRSSHFFSDIISYHSPPHPFCCSHTSSLAVLVYTGMCLPQRHYSLLLFFLPGKFIPSTSCRSFFKGQWKSPWAIWLLPQIPHDLLTLYFSPKHLHLLIYVFVYLFVYLYLFTLFTYLFIFVQFPPLACKFYGNWDFSFLCIYLVSVIYPWHLEKYIYSRSSKTFIELIN